MTTSKTGASTRHISLKITGFLALLCSSLLARDAAFAQTTGRIDGTAREESGIGLPGVTMEAASPKLQGVRTAVTDSAGRYRFPELPPGPYRVRATLASFRPDEKSVSVSLDETKTLDFTLKLAAAESMTVKGEAPLVDVSSTSSGTTYTSEVVAKLPVARNYADIVRANPGVNTDKGETQGRSLALTVYGATSAENQWIIDGVNTTNVLKGFQGKAINTEFVEEVEVKTGGYQAEYGGALGGIINVITKSGGNAFHGDAFAYYDSEATRARQIVTNRDSLRGMKVTPDQRWDFGADLGGYVLQDRLWFFAAYDRVETPGTASRYQTLVDRFDRIVVPNSLQFPRDQTDDLYSAKLTWNISVGSTLVATAFSDPSEIRGAAEVGTASADGTFGGQIQSSDPSTWDSRQKIGGTDYGVRFSRLLGSSAVLAVQGSRHRDRFEVVPSSAGGAVRLEDRTCDGGMPQVPCDVPFEPNSVSGGLGRIDGSTQRSFSRRDQFRVDGTYYFEGHEIKAGVDYQDDRTTSISSFTGGQAVQLLNDFGQLYYRHDFLVRSETDLTPADRRIETKATDKGAYLQDTWRFAPGWTVNAGLRWDQADLRNYLGEPIIQTHEWQPRVGLVWDPTRKGRMKVYAFAGRFDYSLPTDLSVFTYGATIEKRTFNFDPIDRTQSPNVIGHTGARVLVLGAGEPVDSGLKGIYQDEISVGAEKLLDATLSVGIKGTYRRLGRWIDDRCDLDSTRAENGFSSCAIVNPGSGGRYARGDFYACNGVDSPFEQCGNGAPPTPPARRVYRGIEIVARKSIRQRLWLQGFYVYSSLRGNVDGAVDEIFGPIGQADPGANADFDYPALWHQSYGRLFLDRPHSGRLDATYTAFFGLFAGIGAFLQSGAPLNKQGYFNEIYGGAPVHLVRRGYAGRLPALWEADLTVGYPIVVGPATVTAQVYLYNAFNNQTRTQQAPAWTNRPPPGYPDTLYDPNVPSNNPNYGRILARQGPRLFRTAMRVSF